MTEPDPSPSGENARSATPAAPRQPEGREVRFGVDETGEPTYRRTTATEPEGQDLSDAEIASIEKEPWVGATVIAQMPFECMTCGAQFATVPSDYKCPNDGGGLTSGFWRVPIAPSPRLANSLLAEVKRHRAQPAVSRADAEPSADAPLVAELEMEHCSLCEQMAVDGHELYTCDCCGKLVCSVHSDNAGEHEIVCDSCISLVESRLGREDKADAAPLDALREALRRAEQRELDALAELDETRAALASAEGASAAPRLQPEGHIPLGAPDARPDKVLEMLKALRGELEYASGFSTDADFNGRLLPLVTRANKLINNLSSPASAFAPESNAPTAPAVAATGPAPAGSANPTPSPASGPSPDARLVAALAIADRYYALAPKHSHSVPGIWDGDNGVWAGKPCKYCAEFAADGERLIALASSAGPSPDALRDEALGTLKLLLAEHERTLRVLSATTDVELSVEVEMARAVLRRGGR